MVIKRDGRRVEFDETRIHQAILRAGAATGEFDTSVAARLAANAARILLARSAGEAITIEQIQDEVELQLMLTGHLKTARSYIVYREQRKVLRADKRSLVDVESSINEYLTRQGLAAVSHNANQGYSLGGLILNISGKITANYWLSHVYPPEVGTAHRNGDVHIHDLDMLCGYCAGWSLRTLLMEGLNGVPGKVEASPPKHMHSAIGQIDELSRHPPERMGRRPGVFLLRHLHGGLHPQGPHALRGRAAVHPGAHLQSQRPLALGHADAFHQPHLRLDLPGRPQKAGANHRRRERPSPTATSRWRWT